MAEKLTLVLRVLEVKSSNPESAKSYTALQTAHHHFNFDASSCFNLSAEFLPAPIPREEGVG